MFCFLLFGAGGSLFPCVSLLASCFIQHFSTVCFLRSTFCSVSTNADTIFTSDMSIHIYTCVCRRMLFTAPLSEASAQPVDSASTAEPVRSEVTTAPGKFVSWSFFFRFFTGGALFFLCFHMFLHSENNL